MLHARARVSEHLAPLCGERSAQHRLRCVAAGEGSSRLPLPTKRNFKTYASGSDCLLVVLAAEVGFDVTLHSLLVIEVDVLRLPPPVFGLHEHQDDVPGSASVVALLLE